NSGPDAATALVITSALPAGVTFVSASNGGTYNSGPNTVTWPATGLANGASLNYTVTVLSPTTTGNITNTVSSTATSFDGDASNNNGTASGAQVVTTVKKIGDDNSSSAKGTTASLTWSHTVASGSNRILTVGVSYDDETKSVSGVTYGGVAM